MGHCLSLSTGTSVAQFVAHPQTTQADLMLEAVDNALGAGQFEDYLDQLEQRHHRTSIKVAMKVGGCGME